MFLFFICTYGISSIPYLMGLHRNAELQISGTKVPQIKHNLHQEKLYSTVTLYSDQPTHGIAPECGIHLPGVQNTESKYLWHLTE